MSENAPPALEHLFLALFQSFNKHGLFHKMLNFLHLCQINSHLFQRVEALLVSSPTPVPLPEFDPDIPALEETDTEGNDEDIEAVLAQAGEDLASPECHYIEEGGFTQHAC